VNENDTFVLAVYSKLFADDKSKVTLPPAP